MNAAPLVPVKMLKTGEMDGVVYLAGIEYQLDEEAARRLMRTVPSFRNEDDAPTDNQPKEHPMAYTYRADKDGTDETFDIVGPTGEHLASVPYWEEREKAETVARGVVDIMNRIYFDKE